MQNISTIIDYLHQRLFRKVISENLVYNTSWEDPRLDRHLLQINTDSRILMLTGAGDNALHYLLDQPMHIDCVDINPAQNALLELKKAFFKQSTYDLLWEFFGDGKVAAPEFIYHQQLRAFLSKKERKYWDHNIACFSPTTDEPGFYFKGTSGKVALMIHRKIKREGLYPQVLKLLKANSLKEQASYYEKIETILWNSFRNWLLPRRSVMSMLGVPPSQHQVIDDNYQGGLLQYIRSSLKSVFTERPVKDNYFWRVYLTGSYTLECCPNYLRESNFNTISRQVDMVQTYTSTLLNYLKHHTGTYTHIVLLDHQDWLMNYNSQLLKEEWKHILAASEPGTRILFRSVAATPDFLPDFVSRQIELQTEMTAALHTKSRVGTYESTHLGIVQ